jgi:hypothetical protein
MPLAAAVNYTRPRSAYVAMMLQKNGHGCEHKFLAMQ